MFLSPIQASWWLLDLFRPPEPKNVWFLISRHDVRPVHEKLFRRRFEEAIGCKTHFGLLSPKMFDSHFLDMISVDLMNNFLLADSSELFGVGFILASSAEKRLIPTLYTWCKSRSWKLFFSPIRGSSWLLDWFWCVELKNVWLPLSRHDVRRVDEKFSCRRFERADGC